jgi:signal transduction histidine kinase
MTAISTSAVDPALLARLAAHRTIGAVPREQLEWLCRVGHLESLEAGAILTRSGLPVAGLYILLEGHIKLSIDRGTGPHMVAEWHGGDVTGLLPYSRLSTPPGDAVAEKRTEYLMIDPPDVQRMIHECHELTAVLVHVMLDRVRIFKSSELFDEKMASLGRLAAGLAHELNNPASAVARSARTLVAELEKLDDSTKRFCQLNLSDTQCFSIAALRDERPIPAQALSPMEIADGEDALSDWLDARGVDGVPVEELAASAFAPADLDALAARIGPDKLAPVLSHIAAGQTVRRLAQEINMAASRIHALVDAVKGFTYMDQGSAMKPIAIGRGLTDTVTVLGSKARSKSVEIRVEIEPNLPAVDGYGGELNQVWSNLLDNAIDASPKGHVRITAGVELDKVIVRVIDDGPGIPAETLDRIFDPFFTTKPVGQGTGLGLDIARRIVLRHHGDLDASVDATGTTFRVTLPISKLASQTP